MDCSWQGGGGGAVRSGLGGPRMVEEYLKHDSITKSMII